MECETAIPEFEANAKQDMDQVVDVSDCQTKLKEDKILKTKSNDQNSAGQNELCGELQSDEETKMLCCDVDHAKECIWKITNFFQLPTYEDYSIDSEEFSFANATWCLRVYPNGKKGYNCGCIHLLLVRLKSCNSEHRIHYTFGLKTRNNKMQKSLIHSVTYADGEEMGFVNLIERLDVFNRRKTFAQDDILTVICEIFLIEEVTVPLCKPTKLFNQTSEIEPLETSTKVGKLCLESALSNPEIYVWKINNFLELPMDEDFFINSAEFSVANTTWCMRLYPNGQKGHKKKWIHLFLVRVCSDSEPRVYYRLGFKKLNDKELGTLIHDATFLTNGMEMGVVNLLKRSNIAHEKRIFLENGTLTAFCQIYMGKECGVTPSSALSTNQSKPSSKFQPLESEKILQHLCPQTVLSIQDSVTWKIRNFFELPINEGYFMDSREFSFANATWCLRIYPNGKQEDHSGWVHLFLVRLKSCKSKHQVHYRLGLKVQDGYLHETFTHMVTLHANTSKIGIVNPLKRSDVSKRMVKCTENGVLEAFCEIVSMKEDEMSSCTDVPELSSEYQTVELSKHLHSAGLHKDTFIWKIPNFSELPMNSDYFTDSKTFSIANAVWRLRMYPNGQNGENSGWISLLLVRLQSSSSHHCVHYRLGLETKGKGKCETLTHVVTVHANAEEIGVVNLLERSDVINSRKKYARKGILTVFCEMLMIEDTTVEITDNTAHLKPSSHIPPVKKPKSLSIGILEKQLSLDAKDIIWQIPFFLIQPMEVGQWMDSPVFSFLNEVWCLRIYIEKKNVKDWKIRVLLVRYNTCSSMYFITYELSIMDSHRNWLKFKKDNCQGIYQKNVMKLGVSQLYISPDGFATLYFQMRSKDEKIETSVLTEKSRYGLALPMNYMQFYEPSQFRYGVVYERPFLAAAEVTWKIPDFFKWRKEVDDKMSSPVFDFSNDTWLLQLYPNGHGETPGKISFVLTRLHSSNLKHHIICYFSIMNSDNIITRCRLECMFEGDSKKSHPVHLEQSKIIKQPKENVPNGVLTVFFQIYVIKKYEEAKHLEPMTTAPLNTNPIRYGLLFQQSFVAVTEITWKIPVICYLEKEDYINSPVFILANDAWLLQLYPKGYETLAEKISLFLVRLSPSDINHQVICKFSLKNSNNVVNDKGYFENIFKDKILKSSPIHLKRFRIMKKKDENDSEDLLTVFCEMYIVENNIKAALKKSSKMTPEQMTVSPLSNMERCRCGTLVQQSFLAATEIVWKIPDFFRLGKIKGYFINSPVFGLANDIWLLHLYPNGCERTAGKISCVLVRLYPSAEHHIVCKFSIKNRNNMVIESGSCVSCFKDKILKSCPVHLKQYNILNKAEENVPEGNLTLFCEFYIIDDKREAAIEAPLWINQSVPAMIDTDIQKSGMVDVKQEKKCASPPEDLNSSSQETVVRTDKNALKNGTVTDATPANLNIIEEEKIISNNPLDVEYCAEEKKDVAILEKDVHLVSAMVDLEQDKNITPSLEELKHATEEAELKDDGKTCVTGNDLDSNSLKEENFVNLSQLDEEYPNEEKKDVLEKDTDLAMVSEIDLKSDEDNSAFLKELKNNTQKTDFKDDGNVITNEKIVGEFNLALPMEKKGVINDPSELEYPVEDEKHKRMLDSDLDLVMESEVDIMQNENNSSVSEKSTDMSQETDFKDNRNVVISERISDELNFTLPVENRLVKNESKELEYSIKEEKDMDLFMATEVDLMQDKDNSSVSEALKDNIQKTDLKDDGNVIISERISDELNVTFPMESKVLKNEPKEVEYPIEDEKVADLLMEKEVDLMQEEDNSSVSEALKDNIQKTDFKDDGNVIISERISDELNLTLPMENKLVKNESKEVEYPIEDKKDTHLFMETEVDLMQDENNSSLSKVLKDNIQDIVSKDEVNNLTDGKGCDEIDFTLPKQRKKRPLSEMIWLKSHKRKNVSNDQLEETVIREDRNAVDVTFADLNIVKEEKIMSNNQFDVDCHSEEKKDVATLGKDSDLSMEFKVDFMQDVGNSSVSEALKDNTEKTDFKDDGNVIINRRISGEHNLALPMENKVGTNESKEIEYPIEDEKAIDKIQKDSEKVPLCEEYDIRFFVKGEEIWGNSADFKDQSTYFATIVQHQIMKDSSMVVIDDSDPQIFKIFLHYLYTGHVDSFTSENMFGLYLIANKYGIQKLKTECLQYMKDTITVDNFCDIMDFSLQQQEMEITELATDFFSKNAIKITSSTKWQKFRQENYTFANELLVRGTKI